MYAVYPVQADMQDVMETCFINMLWKDHKVNLGTKEHYFTVDEKYNQGNRCSQYKENKKQF